MVLGDGSIPGVDGDHWESHLEDPPIHDDLHRVGQRNAGFVHRLV